MTLTEAPVGRLVVCPTPIGNLEDVTLRVLAALRDADLVACEDTRHTRVLLDRHGISARLLSFHEHNEHARARRSSSTASGEGAVVALVSDAGTPLVSDPGFALVRGCLAAGLALEVLPGPSAVLTALVASGLPAERWRFVGFLPRARGELQSLLGGGDGDAGRVRVATSPGRDARAARSARPGAPGGGVPGADQAPRGGPPRGRRRAGGPLPQDSGTGRGGARVRRRPAGPGATERRAGRAARSDRRRRQGATGGRGGGQADRARRQRALPGDSRAGNSSLGRACRSM